MMTFVKEGDQIEGPFVENGLKIHINTGRFTADMPARHRPTDEWSTLGELHPDLFQTEAPPVGDAGEADPSTGANEAGSSPGTSADELVANLEMINRLETRMAPPAPQTDALERAEKLAGGLLKQMERRWGDTARPTRGFYAHRAVTQLIQRVRLDLMNDRRLTGEGKDYLACVAAYLALIAVHNWERRGLKVTGHVQFERTFMGNKIFFQAERERDGRKETYAHDFLADVHELLLKPKQMFPYMTHRLYAMESLTLPSPEYLYLFGVALMTSPSAIGNWPQGEALGCMLPEDFDAGRNLLVDDLHDDCGLPRDHEGFRKLSWWVVFPPYGWDQNDANNYNMMTLFSSVMNGEVTRDEAVEYLRALLTCQGMEIRNFAARCLMVYRVPPRDAVESSHYLQALDFRDADMGRAYMAKYQHQMEGVENTPEWQQQCENERREWIRQTPPILSHRTAAESDPEYRDMEQNPPGSIEEGIAQLESVMSRHPDDWVLEVIHAHQLLQGPDPARGEQTMRELIQDPPECFEGHSRYGTWLKYVGGRRNEAFAVYEDALTRWPWCQQASDACIWMLTDGTTE